MKTYAKRLKAYDNITFNTDAIIAGMSRLKGSRRKPTSVALEEDLLDELKSLANKRGVPYQVLMRLLIADGIKRLKAA
ncbi:MAG: ribbon-helix-helix protein, CopG family [Deltaproteobacteria bacterium]|nr:ribbon-helix-helix protein, CopG family [Deltaproteobacteria bacterium]